MTTLAGVLLWVACYAGVPYFLAWLSESGGVMMAAPREHAFGDLVRTYIVRAEGFYPLSCRDDEDARRNAEHNPGTLRVEDASGRVVWRQQ